MEPIEVRLHQTAKERYLNYAMSVITSRALPDVRDGLKPVQRRILYAMYNMRLTHDTKHRKSAAVVGDVMAKFHPHGDSSIYDAMVRMAQPFSMRYMLVDGHGNFGSLDGDGAAAMRYTEARLAPLASELLSEIRKETVEFRPNYDSTTQEPIVLPAQVPNLLINGATGIAVGMATNIPPHNVGECLDALVALIDKPELTVGEIVGTHIHGPDFPTGGVMLESVDELRTMYEEGQGSVTLQSNWMVESEAGKKSIVITSVPYTVNKASLIEKIASHVIAGKLPQIIDVRDESTAEVRVVLELKRGADVEAAMAYLFKHTPLQNRFHVNMTCLVPTANPNVPAPARLNLVEVLNHFLQFRMEVVTRRLEYDLAQLLRRIHILEGFEIIFSDIDEAIRIIRASDGKADAAKGLIAYFGVDEEQADAVLETKLYRLAKLEIHLIIAELEEKRAEAARLQTLLNNDDSRWALIRSELMEIRSAYADARRTSVDVEVKALEYSEEAYIVDESVWMIVTRDGWIKRQKSYSDLSAIRVREGDEVRWVMPGRTRQCVMFFTSAGRVYTKRIIDILQTTGYGEPIQGHFDFEDGEKIVGVITDDKRVLIWSEMESEQTSLVDEVQEPPTSLVQMVAVSEGGQCLRFSIEDFLEPSTVKGRRYMRLNDKDNVVNVENSDGTELVAIASRNGRGLMFAVSDISYFKNAAKGVRAMSLDKGDDILDFTLCRKALDGLEVETNRGARVVIRATKSKFEPAKRGNKGKAIIQRGHLIRSHRPAVEIRPDAEDEIIEPEVVEGEGTEAESTEE
ncbi:MAG: DNA topoisomerase IV subunit A [bacterium]